MALSLMVLACASVCLSAVAQGFFQNLDFEGADVAGYAPGSVMPAASALPGWSVDFSPGAGQVWYDALSLGGALISICDSNTPSLGSTLVLQGNYSALLFGGEFGPSTIRQTGLVPDTARSLQINVGNLGYTFFTVSLGDKPLNLVPLATYPSYTRYGCDISSFAGKTVSLSLTAPIPPSPVIPPSWFLVDGLEFSTEIVPEPNPFYVCALGLVLAGFRLLNRRRQCPGDE